MTDPDLSTLTLAELRGVIRRGEAARALLAEAMAEAGGPAASVVAPAAAAPPPRGGPSVEFTPAELALRARTLRAMREEMPEDIKRAMGEDEG